MNIIIPLGGKGERFSKNGYTQPKPLIPILDKCMIEYVLDNLTITSVWFGTTPQDELIDKNFPYFFISKMFYLIEFVKQN